MIKKNFCYIDRRVFIDERYTNFLKKKKQLVKIWPLKFEGVLIDFGFGFMTNLDAVSEGKLLKDTVICDRCNEDILDSHVLLFENSFVYHEACVKNDDWFIPRVPCVGVKVIDNVVSLAQWRKEHCGEQE